MFSLIKNKNQHKISIATFYVLGCLVLVGLCVSFWMKEYIVAFIPVIGIAACIFTLQPSILYFLFIGVLPFAMEFEFGGIGLDLPSEPLLIGLFILSVFWFVGHNREAFRIVTHPLSMTIALHLIWVYCCVLSSSNFGVSLKFALSKSWYIVGSLVGTYWMVYTPQRFLKVLWILILGTGITMFIINIEHGLEGFTFESIGAACNPLYRNHVIYGVFLVMILPFVFVLRTQTKKQSIFRLTIDVLLILFFWSIYFTYTRGAWLALPFMIGAWICIQRRWIRWLYPAGVIAAIVFFIYLSKDYHYLKYAPEYENTIYHDELGDHLSATFEGKDMSTMERFHRWIAAFRLFREHPIMGVGPSTFVDVYKPYTSPNFETYISENEERSTVHNYFIYVLAEQGIVGFIIVVVMVGTFFIYGERKYHQIQHPLYKNLYLACLLCGVSFWLNNLFSDLLEANKVAPLWFFCIAWMIRMEFWDKKTANEESLTAR